MAAQCWFFFARLYLVSHLFPSLCVKLCVFSRMLAAATAHQVHPPLHCIPRGAARCINSVPRQMCARRTSFGSTAKHRAAARQRRGARALRPLSFLHSPSGCPKKKVLKCCMPVVACPPASLSMYCCVCFLDAAGIDSDRSSWWRIERRSRLSEATGAQH